MRAQALSCAVAAVVLQAGLCAGDEPLIGSLTLFDPAKSESTEFAMSPFTHALGLQEGNLSNTEVFVFGRREAERFCDLGRGAKSPELLELVRGRILITDFLAEGLSHTSSHKCWGTSTTWTDQNYVGHWCGLGAAALVEIKPRAVGLYYYDQDGWGFESVLQDWPNISTCYYLEVKESAGLRARVEAISALQAATGSVAGWTANLTVSLSECTLFFDSSLVQLWMRGVLGSSLLLLGLYSAGHSVSNTYRNKRNQLINTFVLTVNAVDLTLLGFVLLEGGFRLSPNVSIYVSNFFIPIFFGSGVATTYLLAARWNEIKHERLLKNLLPENRARESSKRRVVIGIAVLCVTLDCVISGLYVSINDETETLLVFTLPIVLFCAQVLVLAYLVVQVRGMLDMLKELQSYITNLRRSNVTQDMIRRSQAQSVMIAHISFWVSIAVAAAVTNLVFLLVAAFTDDLQGSCDGWIAMWSTMFVAKFLKGLAETKVCSPTADSRATSKVESEEM
jgi:hypothetical protein